MRHIILLLILVAGYTSYAQDTLRVLSLNAFLSHVREHHPVSLVATNSVEQAGQAVRLSKGSFDPAVFAGIDQKYFDGVTYYSTLSTGVKIPTRLGVDFKAAADWNSGQYLNPQLRVPADGLTYLGVEVPVGRGLFTDDRRTQLKRAEVTFRQSVTERQLTLNDLLYEAGQAFLNWQEQQAQLDLAREGLGLAALRLDQVKTAAEIGDRPSIDTTEAAAQYFNRLIEVDQRLLNEMNARLQVAQYLWDEGLIPLELETYVRAEPLEPTRPPLAAPEAVEDHPWLSWYDLKLQDLNLEKRLKTEQLKPQLNFSYNLLQTPDDLVSANLSFTNYKWGASFYVPILLRKERAALQITKLKIASAQYELQMKEREINIKNLQVANEWNTNWAQSQSAEQASRRYLDLTVAERSLFELGESSLFLVNAREMSYLGAQSKYIEYAAKTRKSALAAEYARGELGMP